MTKLVGILNLTPDSFSDGGHYMQASQAFVHCEKLLNDGADIIDVGAESTRPQATPLTADEEWDRLECLLPSLITLTHAAKRLISIDTYHPQTARRALDMGADWINDVSGLTHPEMIAVARTTSNPFVIMHHLGIPAKKDVTLDPHQDPFQVLNQWIADTLRRLQEKGINSMRLIFDPGIGFGKTPAQSIHILEHIDKLCVPPSSLYIGHSRKSFLSTAYPNITDRDQATLEMSRLLINKDIAFLRVHDIAQHMALLSSFKTDTHSIRT